MIDPADALRQKVARALEEDLGTGDVTSEATVPEDARARARIVQKEPGVVCGLEVVAETMRQCGVEDVDKLVVEGQWREHVPAEVLLASGSARGLLAAERTALNFLGHLSGVATVTRRLVDLVAGTDARICDTRKTLPGLRAAQKRAVVHGGGVNHRFGLHDAVLVKDNHIGLGGGLEAVLARLDRSSGHLVRVEVEVDTLEQLRALLEHDAKRLASGAPPSVHAVLLDNMPPQLLREAVALVREHPAPLTTEASGGITGETVAAIAATGVDLISSGSLTQSVRALDVAVDLRSG